MCTIFHTVFIFWEAVISYKALQMRFTNAGTLKRYISVGMLRKTILLHTQDDTSNTYTFVDGFSAPERESALITLVSFLTY